MKKTLLILVLFVGSFAQAKSRCVVAVSGPEVGAGYSQTVFSDVIEDDETIALKSNGEVIRGLELGSLKDRTKSMGLDEATFVRVSAPQSGLYRVTAGAFDFSRMDKESSPVDAMAIGAVHSTLGLVVPNRNLSVSCQRSK